MQPKINPTKGLTRNAVHGTEVENRTGRLDDGAAVIADEVAADSSVT